MLIVCPSCATSYMIDPASVGSGGRMVRCARCRTTWFAGAATAENDVNAFVDSVIAEAESDTGAGAMPPGALPDNGTPPAGDFSFQSVPGGDMPEASPEWPPAEQAAPEHLPPMPEFAVAGDETVPITDAPSLVPPIEHMLEPGAPHAAPDSDDVESFAARRKRLQTKRKTLRRSSRWTALILVLFAFNVALVGARNEVVRYLPQTASLFALIGMPVNLRHLKFDNVRITKEMQDGVTILMVEGNIVSASDKAVEVPRLCFAARNASGQEIYTWMLKPERSILGAGESLKFQSRLASPPPDASDVMVRFFTAADAAAVASKK
jgi:predicted Zn finger-like uncharacterized protein